MKMKEFGPRGARPWCPLGSGQWYCTTQGCKGIGQVFTFAHDGVEKYVTQHKENVERKSRIKLNAHDY